MQVVVDVTGRTDRPDLLELMTLLLGETQPKSGLIGKAGVDVLEVRAGT